MAYVLDRSMTGIERNNGAAALGGSYSQVAEAATEVKDAPTQMGQSGKLERIQFKATRTYLLLKLRVKKLNA